MPGAPQPYKNAWAGDPSNDSAGDYLEVTLGLRMRTLVAGRLMGVRFFRDLSDAGEHIGWHLADANLRVVDTCRFHHNPAAGSGADRWHSAYFRHPTRYAADDRFVVAVTFTDGNYWLTPGGLALAAVTNGNLEIVQDGDGGDNGLFTYGSIIPVATFGSAAYGVDCIFLEDN